MSIPTKSRRIPVKTFVHPEGLTEVFYSVTGEEQPKPKVWQSITKWLTPARRMTPGKQN